MKARLFVSLFFGAAPLAAVAGACGGGSPAGAVVALDAAGFEGSRLDAPIHPTARCLVTIDAPLLLPAEHVPIGTNVTYDSNPPSSGPHYPIWAAYQTYASPVPRPYYVHDLEHGAIVFVYQCPAGACSDVVTAMQSAADAIPDDPLCSGEGVRVRTVITPDPLLDVPVAAAAWGWTYKAECVDLPSLRQFALDHYGQGPEQLCANGQTQF